MVTDTGKDASARGTVRRPVVLRVQIAVVVRTLREPASKVSLLGARRLLQAASACLVLPVMLGTGSK